MKVIITPFRVAFALLVLVVAGGIYSLNYEFQKDQEFYIHIMETRDEFSGSEVDVLWRFRNEHGVSDRFEELYQKKIENLPGWRQGEDDEISWNRNSK